MHETGERPRFGGFSTSLGQLADRAADRPGERFVASFRDAAIRWPALSRHAGSGWNPWIPGGEPETRQSA